MRATGNIPPERRLRYPVGFPLSQHGMVAGFPTFRAIGKRCWYRATANVLSSGRGQFRAIAGCRTPSAISDVAIAFASSHPGSLRLRQYRMIVQTPKAFMQVERFSE
jgi:hypothetical protein